MTDPNGRLTNIQDVILACQEKEIPAYVVGRWVWASFSDKPSEEIRDALKTMGFRWIDKRKAWAHNCGYHSKPARGYDPRDKYGMVPVTKYTDADIAHLETI